MGHRGAHRRAVRHASRADPLRAAASSSSAIARPRTFCRCSATTTARRTRPSPRSTQPVRQALERDITALLEQLNVGGCRIAGGAERVSRSRHHQALRRRVKPTSTLLYTADYYFFNVHRHINSSTQRNFTMKYAIRNQRHLRAASLLAGVALNAQRRRDHRLEHQGRRNRHRVQARHSARHPRDGDRADRGL